MPVSPEQSIQQATRHSAHLERLKSGDFNELRRLLSGIEDQLLGRVSRNDITRWTRSRAERQISAIRDMLRQRYDEGIMPTLRRQIGELAAYESGFEVRSLENVVIGHQFTLPSESQVVAAVTAAPLSVTGPDGGKLLETFISDWTGDQVSRVSNTIRQGFAQGETTFQLVSRLRQDVLPINRRGLEAMTRTALQHTASIAREATWQANSDIVKGVRWVATLDSRTSTQCRSLDGQQFPMDKGPRPPIHVGCRSSTVAVLDERFNFLDEGATRTVRNPETGKVGRTDADTTFYGWLKGQPGAVQDSIIGPTRGKLLRDGGLSAQRFAELQLGKNFKPLTLAEMKELDPVAFMRAGID